MNNIMTGNSTVILQYSEVGALVPAPASMVNRASLFGDGVFETMVYIHGKIRFGKEHQERLNLGLETLKINHSSLNVQKLEFFINKSVTEKDVLRVRWNVYRAGLGKYLPQNHQSLNLLLLEVPSPSTKIKKKSYISRNITLPSSPWSHCKTLNGLTYVMANMEREEKKMDEVILLSQEGFIAEAGIANIFWIKDGVYYTPSLSCNCIAGVSRRKIIETLKNKGLSLEEGKYKPSEIFGADQIFTSNVSGISHIAQLEEKHFKTTALPLLEELFL